MGLSAVDTETVAWLVEHHLVMSTIAQSRDLSDRKTIENFCAIVQSLERMKLLTVLTTADIRAVGPGVWNSWKAQLLRALYYEAEPALHRRLLRGQPGAARRHRAGAVPRRAAPIGPAKRWTAISLATIRPIG